MNRWILYILECSDGSLYTGITTNIDRRLRRHNEGKASKYPRVKKPAKLVYTKVFNGESSTRKKELEIKKLSRQDKLKLIKLSA